MHRLVPAFLIPIFTLSAQQPVELVQVVSKPLDRKLSLPGEFSPYQEVAIHAKVTGFVDRVLVDLGSMVKKDDLLATLDAPEIKSQLAGAQAHVQSLEARRSEAQAKLISEESTYDRLKGASATPGAISGNELIQAEKSVDAARAQVGAAESSIKAAQAAVQAIEEMQKYLTVTAPFDGVITQRNVHPGALVGPGGDKDQGALFRLEQNSRLRLVVAVPEVDVSGISTGARVSFTVPAYPGQTFSGVVSRVSHSMDPKTRAMAVEMDVANPRGELAPGMYPTLAWPVHRSKPSLIVPASSVVTTTERTFVIRANNGTAEWVNVTRGAAAGPDTIEVIGPLQSGDMIVKRASDEIREGTRLR
ncbi:MAG TPA: efflux RND transporter periplasmic adaptor subunit [Bryobacteraceae bacterium]|nr:efflux RND transporter periplasmic adaptor subunit [Bryobacteraceae bacterium]